MKSNIENNLEIQTIERVYDGHFKVQRLVLRFRQFSGSWSPPIIREQIQRGDASALLLYDPKLDKVVLVEQLRIGAIDISSIRDSNSPWLLELVAGLVSEGEDPIAAVRREAFEEAGYVIEAVIPIMHYWNTPGAFTERTSIYCALVDAQPSGGLFGLIEEHEDIRVQVKDRTELMEALQTGKWVTSASTVIALQWLALNYRNFYERV